MGFITDVKKSYSTVRSIIDDDSNVYGTFLKTSDSCIVSGNLQLMNDGVIEVSSISGNAKIEDGYEVVTSQISDKYLSGILIGYVHDLKKDGIQFDTDGISDACSRFSQIGYGAGYY